MPLDRPVIASLSYLCSKAMSDGGSSPFPAGHGDGCAFWHQVLVANLSMPALTYSSARSRWVKNASLQTLSVAKHWQARLAAPATRGGDWPEACTVPISWNGSTRAAWGFPAHHYLLHPSSPLLCPGMGTLLSLRWQRFVCTAESSWADFVCPSRS